MYSPLKVWLLDVKNADDARDWYCITMTPVDETVSAQIKGLRCDALG